MEDYPKNIRLYKVETLEDAEYPQEEKYPSGTVLKIGLMWEHTLPKIGEVFEVFAGKLYPTFHTSTVVDISMLDLVDGVIAFKTLNSKYEVRWED